jgi:8-amino-7-oxononanoate synthase
MQTYFITANDTDVGKTYIVGLLARHFAAQGKSVQIIKAIDCGGSGDAEWAQTFAGGDAVSCHTLQRYPAPLAPLAEDNAAQNVPTLPALLHAIEQLPRADVRLIEGAGGIAVPVDPRGLDWRDFAAAYLPDLIIAVVDNRLGSISQSRMLHHYLEGLPHAFVLNEVQVADQAVKASNVAAYLNHDMPLLACVETSASNLVLQTPELLENTLPEDSPVKATDEPRIQQLQVRQRAHAFRQTKLRHADDRSLNLADNDILDLRHHPALRDAANRAIERWGTSSSASPLISGYTKAHAALEQTLSDWYAQRSALVWNSGYAANQAVLKLFVSPGDLVIADRLIHNSLIAGILQSGARLIRFRHNDVAHLEALLQKHQGARKVHVCTESVYSMDGDYPDLQRIAALKAQYGFTWFLDEAHAVGWYGANGSGLAEATDVLEQVDILVGTLGKALASSGAYTIFKQPWMRDYCVNEAGEFIYSTYLPPASAAIAQAAIELIRANAATRRQPQAQALQFRAALRAQGWEVCGTDSAVVPVICGASEAALRMAEQLREAGIRVGAIRPPTVPKGQARLRLSLKSTLTDQDYATLLRCFERSATAHV